MDKEYRVPLSAADVNDDDIAMIVKAARSDRLSMGGFVDSFERAFADYTGTRHAIAVSSGTAALHLCMIAAGVEAGDEVITSPFSFVASANCIVYRNARPVFADIEENSMNIDPVQVSEKLSNRTRAVLPVHVFGQPCDMDGLDAAIGNRDIEVIEDACEALGAERRGRRAGTFGDAAAFGFFPNKQMTTGEGGMIVTDNPDWDALFRSLRNQGRQTEWLSYPNVGFNYRLAEMPAALGLSQIRRIDSLLEKRAVAAGRYATALAGMPAVTPFQILPDTSRMSWFVYVVRLAPDIDRDRVMVLLDEMGIPSRPYFPAIHLEPFYRERFGYKPGDFPVAERVSQSTLALPFHANIEPSEIALVRSCLKEALARAG